MGNIPSNDVTVIEALKSLTQRRLLMLNTTQCMAGGVGSQYEAGHVLEGLGILSAGLMTPEAAFTKLHLFASLPQLYPASLLASDICGEENARGLTCQALSIQRCWTLVHLRNPIRIAFSVYVARPDGAANVGHIM